MPIVDLNAYTVIFSQCFQVYSVHNSGLAVMNEIFGWHNALSFFESLCRVRAFPGKCLRKEFHSSLFIQDKT